MQIIFQSLSLVEYYCEFDKQNKYILWQIHFLQPADITIVKCLRFAEHN